MARAGSHSRETTSTRSLRLPSRRCGATVGALAFIVLAVPVERAHAQTCSATTPIGAANEEALGAVVQADGRIVVVGYSDVGGGNLDIAAVRYFSTCALDTSFDGDGKLTTPIGAANEQGIAVAIQPDGKIVVAGFSDPGGGNNDFAVVRYNANGSLDTSFDTDGKATTSIGTDDQGRSVAIQTDGKIVVGGWSFTGGSYKFAVVRYNTNGSLDTSFDTDGIATASFAGINEKGFSVALQSDGKIVLAGETDAGGGNFDFGVARFNTNGSLDTSFDTDGKVTTPVGAGGDFGRAVAVQSDGRIVVAGTVITSNFDFGVVRYNTNGSLDTSFDTDGKVTTAVAASNDLPFALAIQPDAKILVAGFSDVGAGNDNFSIVRYNTNGSLDTSFDTDGRVTTPIGSGDDFGYAVTLQPDNKILVTGGSHNGSNLDFAAIRYNANGSVDMTCVSGAECQPLLTTEGSGTLTVTAASSFEMTFDTRFGGGLHVFYDLAEDPARAWDLAGLDIAGTKNLLHLALRSGLPFFSTDDGTSDTLSARWVGSPPKLDLLEATATRVKVRQEAFFQESGGTTVLPLKGIGDYTIYPAGRLALRWNRLATNSVAFSDQDLALGVLSECPPLPACAGLTAYSQTATIPFPEPAGGPFDSDFVLAQREIAGRRTDFLKVLYQDWPEANRVGYDDTVAFLTWRDTPVTTSPLAIGQSDIWNLQTYFKPTNLASNADAGVIGRSADYRGPDALSVTLPASGWVDAAENTSGADFFNESEGAYVLNLDPATGLMFDINGAGTTRYRPFFKIRQWRSLAAPGTVLLEGATQARDVNYRADVKPVSRAYFAQDLLWYSTFGGVGGVTSPNVGSGGTINGTTSFTTGKYGAQSALFDAAGENVSFPSLDPIDFAPNFDFNRGAVEFWYQPRYAHADGNAHVLWHNFGSATRFFRLEKTAAANNLVFTVRNGGGEIVTVTVAPANYSWRIRDWVHLRATWDVAAAGGQQLRLYVNGIEPPHADSGTYTAVGMVVGTNYIGSDSTGASTAQGAIDELHVFGVATTQLLALGGLTTNGNEYLASGTRNVTLSLQAVDSLRRGDYLYFGGDSRFRGLNIALQVLGAGVSPGALVWEYWEGSLTAGWSSLEALPGFTDQTSSLTKSGTIFWTGDPATWSLFSLSGGPELYFVRVRLAPGEVYSTFPIEAVIKTDILLFQHCGDITAVGRTFQFAPPVPTAVELLSFAASGLDGAVELSWQTATEMNNLGFHLYRSASSGGPFERITSAVIPGLGSSPAGARYSYRDAGLVNGVTYHYLLEDIETTGRTTRHAPVSATPQPGPTAPPASGDGAGTTPAPETRLTYGDPSGVSLRIVERKPSGVVLDLFTPGFFAAARSDGTVTLEVPGFEELSSPGLPAIPVKRTWLEAVAGRGVRIASIRALEVTGFTGLRPADAAAREVVVSTEGTVRAGSKKARAAWRGPGVFPASAATVVEAAFQGETKKALVELAPLRWDGASGQLLLARRLRVRVAFAGVEAAERVFRGGRGRRHVPRRSHTGHTVVARLLAPQRGLQRVTFEEVLGSRRQAASVSTLRLSRQGEPTPFHVEPDTRSFGPGSTLYFVSAGAATNPHANEAVYELEEARSGGVVMGVGAASPWGSNTGYHWRRGEWEQNRYYQPGLLEAPSPWLWDVVVSPARKSYPFTLSALGNAPAKVQVWLQGASDSEATVDHHVRVTLNDAFVGEVSWDGKTAKTFEGDVRFGDLREGENRLEVHNLGDTGAAHSMVFLDRFVVTYAQQLITAGVFEGSFDASGMATVSGLGEGAILLQTAPETRWLTGAIVTPAGLSFRVEAGRSYLAVAAGAVASAQVRRAAPTTLRSTRNRADYLLVAPREFLGTAAPLLEQRRRQGLVSKGVAIEDVYDEFGHGEARPRALKEFLEYAYHHWQAPSMRYVVLLGDATYDGKNHLGTGVVNRVPALMVRSSYLWTASDPGYGAVNGDDILPDVAVGRLPAANVEQARTLVEKLLRYEQAGLDVAGPVVLVADNPDGAGDFEANSEAIAAMLPGREIERIYLRQLGAGTRGAILGAFDRGASLMSYVGHGAIAVWASENVLNTRDVASLLPQPRQPILMTMNCLNGYFHFPPMNALAEELLKAESRGVVAAFSPSGLSLDAPAHVYQKALVGELVSGRHARLGDAVMAAQRAYADTGLFPELLELYQLLGDPALKM